MAYEKWYDEVGESVRPIYDQVETKIVGDFEREGQVGRYERDILTHIEKSHPLLYQYEKDFSNLQSRIKKTQDTYHDPSEIAKISSRAENIENAITEILEFNKEIQNKLDRTKGQLTDNMCDTSLALIDAHQHFKYLINVTKDLKKALSNDRITGKDKDRIKRVSDFIDKLEKKEKKLQKYVDELDNSNERYFYITIFSPESMTSLKGAFDKLEANKVEKNVFEKILESVKWIFEKFKNLFRQDFKKIPTDAKEASEYCQSILDQSKIEEQKTEELVKILEELLSDIKQFTWDDLRAEVEFDEFFTSFKSSEFIANLERNIADMRKGNLDQGKAKDDLTYKSPGASRRDSIGSFAGINLSSGSVHSSVDSIPTQQGAQKEPSPREESERTFQNKPVVQGVNQEQQPVQQGLGARSKTGGVGFFDVPDVVIVSKEDAKKNDDAAKGPLSAGDSRRGSILSVSGTAGKKEVVEAQVHQSDSDRAHPKPSLQEKPKKPMFTKMIEEVTTRFSQGALEEAGIRKHTGGNVARAALNKQASGSKKDGASTPPPSPGQEFVRGRVASFEEKSRSMSGLSQQESKVGDGKLKRSASDDKLSEVKPTPPPPRKIFGQGASIESLEDKNPGENQGPGI